MSPSRAVSRLHPIPGDGRLQPEELDFEAVQRLLKESLALISRWKHDEVDEKQGKT